MVLGGKLSRLMVVVPLGFCMASLVPIAVLAVDADFRATRLSLAMPETSDPVPRDLLDQDSGKSVAAVLDPIAEDFGLPRNSLEPASLRYDDYQEANNEHRFSIRFDEGYQYCRTRVFEYHYAGFGAAAMDASETGIEVLAYLESAGLQFPTFFKVELEVLVVRDDLAGTPMAEAVCSEPRQPFYQRHWGGCC